MEPSPSRVSRAGRAAVRKQDPAQKHNTYPVTSLVIGWREAKRGEGGGDGGSEDVHGENDTRHDYRQDG